MRSFPRQSYNTNSRASPQPPSTAAVPSTPVSSSTPSMAATNGVGVAPPQPTPSGDVDLHELAKGWKAAIARASDPATRHEAKVKNDRGNLPLHSAASFRAPLEVAEALLEAYPEAATMTNNYGNLALHFTAWKKGPLDVEKLLLKVYPEGAAMKNNHGNLPLHYAAHYNAPLEVVEALYHAFPEGANQKNNDNNTPLDLAIADGASPNVVALLQGKSVPPTDDEMLEAAKGRCERMEKELQRHMEKHSGKNEDLETVLSVLMDICEAHPHALYAAGLNPATIGDMDGMLDQIHKIAAEEELRGDIAGDEDAEAQVIEDSLCPPDDEVEYALSKLIGLDAVKNQVRGLRRTLEMEKSTTGAVSRHMVLSGNPGTGKSTVAQVLASIFHKIGVVKNRNFVRVGREELIDRKSEARTVFKTRRVLEEASGGILFVEEIYTLLPSAGRPRLKDHGPAALREIAKVLPLGNPLIILSGDSLNLQRVLSSDIGFRGMFLTRMEFPDPTPSEIARMFMAKMSDKGLVPGDGVTVDYLADLISSNTDRDWRMERNGRISDLLLVGVRAELKKRTAINEDASRGSLSPMKLLTAGSSRMPAFAPEEIFVTVEDVQNAIVNGM